MEDKWFICVDGPDNDGHVKLHFYRSWTGNKDLELEIKCAGGSEDESEAWKAEISALSWETDKTLVNNVTEEMAKYQALECCNWRLNVMLVDEIKEPSAWEDLPTFLPKAKATKTYRGAQMSLESLKGLKVGDIVSLN